MQWYFAVQTIIVYKTTLSSTQLFNFEKGT